MDFIIKTLALSQLKQGCLYLVEYDQNRYHTAEWDGAKDGFWCEGEFQRRDDVRKIMDNLGAP